MRCFALLLIASLIGCSTDNTEPMAAQQASERDATKKVTTIDSKSPAKVTVEKGESVKQDCSAPQAMPPSPRLKDFARRNNEFAFRLFRKLKADEPNLAVSPYSVYQLLGMVYLGADGETAEQIRDVSDFPGDAIESAKLFQQMNSIIEPAKNCPATVSIANSYWPDLTFVVKKPFANDIDTYFKGVGTSLDFRHDPESATRTINEWTARATSGRVANFFSKPLGRSTHLVVVNAICFDATWSVPFKKEDTTNLDFRIAVDRIVQTPMLCGTRQLSLATRESYRMAIIPVADPSYAVGLILPNEGRTLLDVESGLSAEEIGKAIAEARPFEVELKVPKCSVLCKNELNDPMMSLGMVLPFSDGADFSRLSHLRPLPISRMSQNVAFSMDEKGVRAAAASQATFSETAFPGAEFICDRPFIYIVFHIPTQMNLIYGRLSNPNSK